MDYLYLVLALLAGGVAESLPIGADAHWVLVGARPAITLFYLNLGAALALGAYCWRDLGWMGFGVWRFIKGKSHPGARATGLILLAAVPALLLDRLVTPLLALSPLLVGLATVGAALLLALMDQVAMTVKRMEHLTLNGAVGLGVIQVLGALPGVGRPLVTVLGCRLLGFERGEALRVNLLVSLVALGCCAVVQLYKLILTGGFSLSWPLLGLSLGSFVTTLGLTAVTTSWLRQHSVFPLVLWRAAVGLGVIWLALR